MQSYDFLSKKQIVNNKISHPFKTQDLKLKTFLPFCQPYAYGIIFAKG
ncbi:hypothetical protein HMPREF1551_01005 [Capnocytophaga sp. oral taxon 863 str. F0517]|nr:hypothetical protein HMPREF1551_01005 [Capnocytophaga sp. oral taxon 863 str. F0517]